MTKTKYRAVFISDVHLGTPNCQAQKLLDFLESVECETLYLVGDIIDFWAMSFGWPKFPLTHILVLRKFLSMARSGTKVRFVVGNHDEAIRQLLDVLTGYNLGGIEFANDFIHFPSSEKSYPVWVTHGDLYDRVVNTHPWLCRVGSVLYDALLKVNTYYNKVRVWLGKPYWSISAYFKYKVKHARHFIETFENALAQAALQNNCKAVVCGHIHWAEDKVINGNIRYMNTGDWVESCTALVEHELGDFEILRL